MELGATLCTPKQPSCSVCPLGTIGVCMAYTEATVDVKATHAKVSGSPLGTDIEECALCIPSDMYRSDLGVTNFPVKLSKRPQREEFTVVIVLQAMRCGSPHFLLFQRPKKGLLGGLWEFPGQTIAISTKPTDNSTEIQEQAQLSVLNRIKSAVKCIHFDASDLQSIGQSLSPNPLQVVHLFSHIRMTYDIYTLSCGFSEVLNIGRWVSANEFAESAVSTAARKVFAHFQSSQNSTCVPKPNTKAKKRKTDSPLDDAKQLRLTTFFH
ncbi:A/G-specific adenine glycosylase [Fasciola hepatica]|uniref:Adenine DNA glycosylase n=1 Tax=Fasciola hepatica TaxID=6192 RepID=A0A4E0R2W7_FASHE|nr:A/G-specific adenine glycosylase [Fasciola hepatica]